jgi:hypothetical protein
MNTDQAPEIFWAFFQAFAPLLLKTFVSYTNINATGAAAVIPSIR